MDYERELIFAFLEEDNTQRAYFRVRPLLTPSGFAQEEAVKRWPDEGGLRIVPDKNEQFYFKDRMRTIGSFCLVDLTPFPAEANKIRTNKNYRPEKDEKNQYIIFSDTVHELPEHTFYEVMTGTPEQFAELATAAVTPLFMIRSDDTFYGPVHRKAPDAPSTAPEMEGTLFDLPCPDGKVRSILCCSDALASEPVQPVKKPAPVARQPKEAPAPAQQTAAPAVEKAQIVKEQPPQPAAPVPPAQDEVLPIGQPLQILDAAKDFDETLNDIQQELPSSANLLHAPQETVLPPVIQQPDAPLTGTPLLKGASVRTSVPRPKNKLQEVVANQWRAAKNDPPAEPLPSNANLRAIVNPVETACEQLRAAWEIPEAHQQLIDYIMSLPGVGACLTASGETTLQQTMQAKLNDIEADRLALLYQLDKAKCDLESFRAQELTRVTEASKQQIAQLEAQQSACEASLEQTKTQINNLLAQRDALQDEIVRMQTETLPKALSEALARAQLVAPPTASPIYLNGRSGLCASADKLIDRAMQILAASGLTANRNDAIAALALLIACRRVAVVGASAPAATLIHNISGAFGWSSGVGTQTSPAQQPVACPAACDSTPLIVLSTDAITLPIESAVRVMLSTSMHSAVHNPAYAIDPYPVLQLAALPFIPVVQPTNDQPLALHVLQELAETDAGSVQSALAPLWKHIPPVSGNAMLTMQRFANIAAPLMDGGLPAACDWIIRLWLIPRTGHCKPDTVEQLRGMLAEYPMSAALLK